MESTDRATLRKLGSTHEERFLALVLRVESLEEIVDRIIAGDDVVTPPGGAEPDPDPDPDPDADQDADSSLELRLQSR
jgi:hypothetical protein